MISNTIFLEGPEIAELRKKAQGLKKSDKVFSDIVDKEGHYYVDLVQQGGGVLGIALVGYTYILEQAGMRFYNLAGTSVGAMATLMMAGLAKIGEPVSIKILNHLARKDIFDFIDGPPGIKKLIQKKVEGKTGLLWRLLWHSCQIYGLLKNHLGLNPGRNLEKWLVEVLRENNIFTYHDLKSNRRPRIKLLNRLYKDCPVPDPKIAIITSEINTHTRVELPDMAQLYWKDPQTASPVQFVSASMAVPYLFYPFEKKNIPHAGEIAGENWKELAEYYGEIPHKVRFVDGGLLSNFPIDIFHIPGVPAKPTFGARLSTYREEHSTTDDFFDYSGAIIKTMRQIEDYEVILKNPDYKQLICTIGANKTFNWLNFNMSKEKQKQLFLLGAEKGLGFLQKFDWQAYKTTRKELSRLS